MEELDTRVDVFRELIEISGDITIVTDREFTIRYISSSAANLFGQEPVMLLGKSIFDLVSSKRAIDWQNLLFRLREGKAIATTFTIPIDEANRFFEAKITKLGNGVSANSFALTLRDITEKKRKENELVESSKHMDQVFYKTTHDLMGPLHSMMGLVNLAEYCSEEDRLQYLSLIKGNVVRLNNYLSEINAFFKGNRLEVKCEKVDIRQLIKEEVESLRNINGSGLIAVETEVEQSTEFYSDSFRVRTIVANLCSNALKYSDLSKEWPFVRIEASIDSNACVLRVQDNGIGIDHDLQKKIFDRFFRATDKSNGTGVGLYIVKDTVQRLKGTIEVSSIKGIGTCFAVIIPNQTRLTVL
jgi:PAS domain S-box-containing protein